MIKIIDMEHEVFTFPSGEVNVKVSKRHEFDNSHSRIRMVDIEFKYEGSDSIIELLLVCDALKRQGRLPTVLKMDYIPFSRQDRVMSKGESLSLKVFCDLINSLNFKAVHVSDPHSDVAPALLNNCYIHEQHEIFSDILNSKFKDQRFYLISPDGGALKKIHKLSRAIKNPVEVLTFGKERDVATGYIKRTVFYDDKDLNGYPCVIVDDICDGGRTFIEIAKILKMRGSGEITLCVTHGFFTKGIEVFNGLIDNIYTKDGEYRYE